MKKRIFFATMALLFAIGTYAQQETKNYPHAFAGLQGGVMRAYNGEGLDRKWSPMGAVSLGYNFTEVFGMRLQANGSKWTAELPGGAEYDSQMGSIDLDLMFNLSNVLFPNRNNFLNVIAIAGSPLNLAIPHTWVDNYARSTSEGAHRWNTSWKVGGMLELNIDRHWAFNVEAGTNYVRQKDHALQDNRKWWPYAMAGITCKFGYKKAKSEEPAGAPAVVQNREERQVETAPAKPVVEDKKTETPKPQPKVQPKTDTKTEAKPAKLAENIFFDLAKADITDAQSAKIEAIVKFAKENPGTKIALVGYADKGTGTTAINKRLSEQRVKAVKNLLVKRGIKAARITADWKGDTVQPFANNDDNRVVIAVGGAEF